LLVVGVLVILIGNLPVVSAVTAGLPLLGSNWSLVGGFLVICAGFGFLVRWR
jgi:hypothetical protein